MSETVDFKSNGNTASGYLAKPASGSGPGVLVIQEWWGLDDSLKEMADRLAAAGFVALAPTCITARWPATPRWTRPRN
jgi:carboxymethylenebutenolidase